MIDILELNEEIGQLSRILPGVARRQYSLKCLIDEITLTNKIEGVYSSRKEIGEALDILEQQAESKRGKKKRSLSLVNKYLKLMMREKVKLETCQDIRELYDDLLLEEIMAEEPKNEPDGRLFRKNATSVYSATGKSIHTGLSPEEKIIDAMEKALRFFHDSSVKKLFRICIFHYLLGYIHPFYDGNGRFARFVVSYGIAEVLEPLLAYRISETLQENISEYYKAFEICNDPHNLGDLTPFLIMMLTMIKRACQELKASLERRLIQWKRYEKLVDSFCDGMEDNRIIAMYNYLIQAALFSENGISTQELMDEFAASYNTIKRILGQIDERLLVSQRKGRKVYYKIQLTVLDDMLFEW